MTRKPTMNEDVAPINHGDFPASHASFRGLSHFPGGKSP